MPLSSRFRALALLFLVVLAAFFYGRDLGKTSLWEDELFSADIVLNRSLWPEQAPLFERKLLFEVLEHDSFWTIKAADQSPPLYELLAKAAAPVFGDSEAGVRSFSALCALLWVVLLAGRGLDARCGTGSRVMAAAALALVLSSGLMFFYAREGRAYALAVALSFYLLLKFWDRCLHPPEDGPRLGWLETLVLAAAALTHYATLILAALLCALYGLQALQGLLNARQRRWRATAMTLGKLSVVLALTLAWLFASAHSVLHAAQGGMGFAPPMSLADFSREALQTMHQQVLGHSAGVLAALVLLAVLGSGWVVFSTRLSADAPLQRFARAVLWLAALALVYTLLHMGSMWRSRIVSVRHFIFLLPLLYLLAGCGVYY